MMVVLTKTGHKPQNKYPEDLGAHWIVNQTNDSERENEELILPDVDLSLINEVMKFALNIVMQTLFNFITRDIA